MVNSGEMPVHLVLVDKALERIVVRHLKASTSLISPISRVEVASVPSLRIYLALVVVVAFMATLAVAMVLVASVSKVHKSRRLLSHLICIQPC